MRPDRRPQGIGMMGLLALSAALHVGLYFAIPRYRSLGARPTFDESEYVEIDAPEPEPEPVPEAAPEPLPEPEPEPVRPAPRAERATEPAETPPPQAAAEPPPAQETPVDFDNLTLSNDQGSWETAQSTGVDREGPIGTPGARVTGRSREGVAGGEVGGTGTAPGPVGLENLARRPVPPDQSLLDGLLRRYYPPEAQAQGVAGVGVVTVVLGPDGRPTAVRARGDGRPAGFGFSAACRRALLSAPAWQPGRDASGSAVPTTFPFTCNFDVNP